MALVRPTLVQIEEVDTALATLFTGISVTLLNGGSTSVPVYVEDRKPLVNKDFPAITIELQDDDQAYENYEASDDEYRSATDTGVTPNEITMTAVPENVKLRYQVTSWIKNDTAAARNLERSVRQLIRRRTSLAIAKRVAEDVSRSLYMIQEGSTVRLKERLDDEFVLQSSWTYGIYCELEQSGERVDKAIHTLEFGLYKGVDKDALYREFEYDTTTFTPK